MLLGSLPEISVTPSSSSKFADTPEKLPPDGVIVSVSVTCSSINIVESSELKSNVHVGFSTTVTAEPELKDVACVEPLDAPMLTNGGLYVPVCVPVSVKVTVCCSFVPPLKLGVSVHVSHERPDFGENTTFTVPVMFVAVTVTGILTVPCL